MELTSYGLPLICWLRVTDYMRGWACAALGSSVTVMGVPVIAVEHLPGAKEIMKNMLTEEKDDEEEVEDTGDECPGNSISATWMNALVTGMEIDPRLVWIEYGFKREMLRQYLPVRCPDVAMSKEGILKPWSNDMRFGDKQSTELQKVLRDAFWRSVGEFAEKYAREHEGEKYAQADMLTDFCKEYGIDDYYVDAMRREWQRRLKRVRS